jgi:hypothetical protein
VREPEHSTQARLLLLSVVPAQVLLPQEAAAQLSLL